MTTLTYDGAESAPGELNAEEQDSLQVGEQMAAEQESLLAGKFQNPEALEKAYLELQTKLGSSTDETDESEPEYEPEEGNTDFLDSLWEQASSDTLSDETMSTLSEMDSTELANMYLEYRNNVEQQSVPSELSDDDISSIQDSVGGTKEYSAMLGWAKDNLTEQEIEMYESGFNLNNPIYYVKI